MTDVVYTQSCGAVYPSGLLRAGEGRSEPARKCIYTQSGSIPTFILQSHFFPSSLYSLLLQISHLESSPNTQIAYYEETIMLAKLILPILPLLALAIPLEKKQNTVQIIENCYESGMVAATFDGQSFCFSTCRWQRDNCLLVAEGEFFQKADETADGPYLYEGDVFRDLNGGKGTFFLNVSLHCVSPF